MWKPANKSLTATSVAVPPFALDEPTYDAYAERATKRGKSIEAEIVERLTLCQGHTAIQALYLADDDLNALSQIAGKTIRTPADLLSWARSISSMTVAGTKVDLSERLLKRLETRCFGKTMPEMLSQTVTECLEERVGLR